MKLRSNITLFLFAIATIIVPACSYDKSGQESQKQSTADPETEKFRPSSRSVAESTPLDSTVTAAVEGLKHGDSNAWNEVLMGRSDAEQWSLLEHAYDQLHERRYILADAISAKAMSSKMPASFAGKLFESLTSITPPKELSTPPDNRGWGDMQKIYHSPKYQIASAIMKSGDTATLARIWREFASLSEDDQQVIGMLASSCGDIEKVSSIVAASRVAKSEDIRISLLDGASRVVAQALADPVRREAALRTAQHMRSSGLASSLLIDALANMTH
jgi:hypothetical protein